MKGPHPYVRVKHELDVGVVAVGDADARAATGPERETESDGR